jgi:hypothetical protein
MSKAKQLAIECKRQSENCLYTSTSLFIWLRCLRTTNIVLIILPLVLGSLAGWQTLTDANFPHAKLIASLSAFLAGLFPVVYAALKFDDSLRKCSDLAGEFKNLHHRFRTAALVSSLKSFSEFETDVALLVDRLEKARTVSYTAPEWCFKQAQKKIKAGDYDFNVAFIDGHSDNE